MSPRYLRQFQIVGVGQGVLVGRVGFDFGVVVVFGGEAVGLVVPPPFIFHRFLPPIPQFIINGAPVSSRRPLTINVKYRNRLIPLTLHKTRSLPPQAIEDVIYVPKTLPLLVQIHLVVPVRTADHVRAEAAELLVPLDIFPQLLEF